MNVVIRLGVVRTRRACGSAHRTPNSGGGTPGVVKVLAPGGESPRALLRPQQVAAAVGHVAVELDRVARAGRKGARRADRADPAVLALRERRRDRATAGSDEPHGAARYSGEPLVEGEPDRRLA